MSNVFSDAVEKVEHAAKNPYVEAAAAATAILAAGAAALYFSKGAVLEEAGLTVRGAANESLLGEIRAAAAGGLKDASSKISMTGASEFEGNGAARALLKSSGVPVMTLEIPARTGVGEVLGRNIPVSGVSSFEGNSAARAALERTGVPVMTRTIVTQPATAELLSRGIPITAEARTAALRPDILKVAPGQRMTELAKFFTGPGGMVKDPVGWRMANCDTRGAISDIEHGLFRWVPDGSTSLVNAGEVDNAIYSRYESAGYRWVPPKSPSTGVASMLKSFAPEAKYFK